MVRLHDYQIYAYVRAMCDLGKRRGEDLFKTTALGRFLLNALIGYMEDPRLNDLDNERVRDGIPTYAERTSAYHQPLVGIQYMTAAEKYELHKEEYIKDLQTWMDMEESE